MCEYGASCYMHPVLALCKRGSKRASALVHVRKCILQVYR